MRTNEKSRIFGFISQLHFLCLSVFFLTAAASAQQLQTSFTSGGVTSVIAGTNITYEFFVTNNMGITATNAALTITLPNNARHAADNGGCNATTAPLVVCNFGNISNGATSSVSVTIYVEDDYVVTTNGAGFLNFSATSTSSEGPTANTVIGDTPVTELADLQITNIAQTPTIPAGQTSWYTIYVDNFGPSAARDVVLTDTLLGTNDPTSSQDNLSIQSCAFSVSQGGGSITQFTCTTGPVVQTQFGIDEGTMRTNVLRVLTNLADDPETPTPNDPIVYGRLRAAFRFLANEEIMLNTDSRVVSLTPDPDHTNNQQFEVFGYSSSADLQLGVSTDAELQPDGTNITPFDPIGGAAFPEAGFDVSNIQVTPGRRLEYRYTITNNGPSDSDNTKLISRLPSGVSVVPGSLHILNEDLSEGTGSCQFGTPGLSSDDMTCGFGTIEADDDNQMGDENNVRTVVFDVMVDSDLSTGSLLVNNLILSSDDSDADNSNNLDSSLIFVGPQADCLGVVNGQAEYDRCGVCNGDGQSCLGCETIDVSEDVLGLHNVALRLRNLGVKAAKSLQDAKARSKAKRNALQLYQENLSMLTHISANVLSCTNQLFCQQVSSIPVYDDVSAGLNNSFVALRSAAGKLSRQGDSKKGRAILKRAKAAIIASQIALASLPVSTSSCS